MIALPSGLARTIFRAQEAALRRPTFACLAKLERSQWQSRAEIEAHQTLALNRFMLSAAQHSPWHAQRLQVAGLDETVRHGEMQLSDLCRLPTMNKRDARANIAQLVWREAPGGVFKYTTGGSSGEPLTFYYGRKRQAADAAGRLRARRWWGINPGEREVYLWGAPIELNKTDRIKTLRDRLVNQLLLNAFEMSLTRMDDYLVAIQAWQPRAIYGYASSLALLCAHAEARALKLRIPALRVVSATGEPLFAHQRELIERVLRVPVSVEYGARDAGLMALESPEHALLQMSETHIIEVLDADGNPATEGEAVITSLVSEAQPFIRYRTGDVVQRSDQSGIGGRGLHVLKAVVGRQTDFVVAADGRVMHALALIYVLRAVPGIVQFKCVQHTLAYLEVLLVTDAHWNEAAQHAVINGLRARLGATLEVKLRILDDIPPEASGKHRYVVSHVRLAEVLQQARA